jgi:23S rRNA (uracil1939-C5)-methyltransferase
MRQIDCVIEKLVAGGEGLARLNGKAILVPGVLPGERVRVRPVEERRDYTRAILQQIIIPSPARQVPLCSLSGVCGGCDWLHIAYGAQLELKTSIFRETLSRIGGITGIDVSIEAGPPLMYRNRAQVHRAPGGRLGYMAAGSRRVVPVSSCPIAARRVAEVFEKPPDVPLERFTVFGTESLFAVEGIDEERELCVTVCGKQIRFSVECFFQSNLAVLERLVPYAVEGLLDALPRAAGRTAVCADLYCGVGLFGSFAAEHLEKLIAVEISPRSVSFARRNIPGRSNEYHAEEVERWIEKEGKDARLDAAIVDPPRVGLSVRVREYLGAAAPRGLVYVSCNPVTLARDLRFLLSRGLRVVGMRLFDFFPQTSHVEAVAVLWGGG